jgi:hypothetical protein
MGGSCVPPSMYMNEGRMFRRNVVKYVPGYTASYPRRQYFLNLFFLTFMVPCIVNVFLNMTNKMQRCVTFLIIVNALHDSSGFSAHHQELKSVHAASGICQACLLLPLAVTAYYCQRST